MRSCIVMALRSAGSFRSVTDLDRRAFFSGLRCRHSGDVLLTGAGDSSCGGGGGASAGGGEGSLGGGGGASLEVPLEDPLATFGGECGEGGTVDGRLGALTARGGSATAGADSAPAGGSWGNSAARTSGRSSVGAVAGCSVTLGSGGGVWARGGAGAGAGAGAGFRAAGAAAPSVLRPRLGLTEMRGLLVDIATLERSASLASDREPSGRNAAELSAGGEAPSAVLRGWLADAAGRVHAAAWWYHVS